MKKFIVFIFATLAFLFMSSCTMITRVKSSPDAGQRLQLETVDWYVYFINKHELSCIIQADGNLECVDLQGHYKN